MPVLEVIGSVGSVFDIVERSIQLVNEVKSRFEADAESGPLLKSLQIRFTVFQRSLANLKKSYKGKKCYLDESSHEAFVNEFDCMQKACNSAEKGLEALNEEQRERRNFSGKVKRLIKAMSTKERLNGIGEDLQRAETALTLINGFLAVSDVVLNVVKRQTEDISEKIEQSLEEHSQGLSHQINQLEERVVSGGVSLDSFEPSFDVPPNPPHVRLDYNSLDEDEKPATFEGRLKAEILQSERGQCTDILEATTGAVGLGGTGKTCAVRGLAGDPEIRERFPDGVYFISLGRDATKAKLVAQLCKIVRLSGGAQTAEQMESFDADMLDAVVGTAIAWFSGRSCLFLVDDIWEESDINAATLTQLSKLAICSEHSSVVFTTRSQVIASLGASIQFEAREAQSKESRDILLRCAGFKEEETTEYSRDAITKLLTLCGGLPVGLAIVGNTVGMLARGCKSKKEEAWIKFLDIYESPGKVIVVTPMHNYESLRETIRASLEILGANCKDTFPFATPLSIPTMFRALCVFEKQKPVPMKLLYRLWKLENPGHALDVAERFYKVSLVKFENRFELLLHDLVHDFVCMEGEKHETASYWHKELLDSFLTHNDESTRLGCRPWWKCWREFGSQSDLKRHLKRAGLDDELSQLKGRPCWEFSDHMSTFWGYLGFRGFTQTEPEPGMVFSLTRKSNSQLKKHIVDSALSVVGTERSERAMRCVEELISFSVPFVVEMSKPDSVSGQSREEWVNTVQDWANNVWRIELVRVGRELRSGSEL